MIERLRLFLKEKLFRFIVTIAKHMRNHADAKASNHLFPGGTDESRNLHESP